MVFYLGCAVRSALGGVPPVESTHGSIKREVEVALDKCLPLLVMKNTD